MKIKQVFAQICISILVLLTVKGLTGGFVFSKSMTYSMLFLALFAASGWIASKIQVFFLLPKILPFLILLHSFVISIIFYAGNEVIGGITIVNLQQSFLQNFSKPVSQQLLGEFGTIGVVSFLIGIVYQVIIWLIYEK